MTSPNILLIMTDEERYPPPYENDAVKAFRSTQLTARESLRDGGLELHRHYAGATACLPSRATLFTGQYPSLHGVSQTDGTSKKSTDPAMVWLDPNPVPTLGDWFRAGGYQSHYEAAAPPVLVGCGVDAVRRRKWSTVADEYGPSEFMSDVFRDGVPDVQTGLHAMLAGPRVVRTDDNAVAILHLDDVLAVTKRRDVHSMDPEMVQLAGAFIGAGRPLIPLMLDGDEHTKYRKLLDPLFAPKVVAQLEPRVRALADELIDGFIGDGRVELYNTFCEPLPSMVFLTLLGLPLDDLPFLIWFKNGVIRPSHDDHRNQANEKMVEYLYAELDRREALGEPGDDLIGGFITAEVEGHRLTREDVIDITFLLVLAGLDTVASSLSCIVDWLARHPDQRQRIIDDPSLLPAAIEELMRYMTPVAAGGRFATADFEIGGEQIRAGDHLRVCWAAANLDDDAFEHPLDIDFDREAKRHIAFASGFHRCLGSHLARLELRVILGALHERIPDYAPDPDLEPGYNNVSIRTVDPLPLVFTPR